MNEHPYDALYLSQVVETQGKFFERLQNIERLSVENLTSRYPGAHDLDLRLAVEKLTA